MPGYGVLGNAVSVIILKVPNRLDRLPNLSRYTRPDPFFHKTRDKIIHNGVIVRCGDDPSLWVFLRRS